MKPYGYEFIQRSLIFILMSAVIMSIGCSTSEQNTAPPLVMGLDHIPLAVRDLEAAAATFKVLGFSLKPGREHDNGIRNLHIKFQDGTEIELITADEALDPLAAEYLDHLTLGDGPAFIGLYAPDMDSLVGWLEADGRKFQESDGLITFPRNCKLRYLFFGSRTPSPTDLPETFQHTNEAQGLMGVWLAGDDFDREQMLLRGMGAEMGEETVFVPEEQTAEIARFPEAEVLLLPQSHQWVEGRRIVGVTLGLPDLEAVQRVLIAEAGIDWDDVRTIPGRSIFIPPEVAHGLWLEFRLID